MCVDFRMFRYLCGRAGSVFPLCFTSTGFYCCDSQSSRSQSFLLTCLELRIMIFLTPLEWKLSALLKCCSFCQTQPVIWHTVVRAQPHSWFLCGLSSSSSSSSSVTQTSRRDSTALFRQLVISLTLSAIFLNTASARDSCSIITPATLSSCTYLLVHGAVMCRLMNERAAGVLGSSAVWWWMSEEHINVVMLHCVSLL